MSLKIAGIEYVAGLDPDYSHARSHLYRGSFEKPGEPMCAAGWNRADGTDYSIIRGDARNGICQECWGNAKERKPTTPKRATVMDEKQYQKDRLEQANREARGEGTDGTSTIGAVRADMTGTVTNPSEKPAPSGASATSGADEDVPDASVGSEGEGTSAAPSGSFGGLTETESPRGVNRTTRETGEHRHE